MNYRKIIGDLLIYSKRFRGIRIEDNIIIAANPRGGSTWLEQVLSKAPGTLSVYEPLNPGYARRFMDLGFTHRTFLNEENVHHKERALFDLLFRGYYLEHRAIFHPNTQNDLQKIAFGSRLLFKFCRINLLLPWLTKNFSLRPPVFILRNPYAQISSQIEFANKFGGDWLSDTYDANKYSFHKAYPNYSNYVISLRGQEQILACQWALSNKLLLEHKLSNKDWINVSYENLLSDPFIQFKSLFEKIGLDFDPRYLEDVKVKSRTTITGVDKLKWKTKLNPKQIDSITEVLVKLDMYKYYEQNSDPLVDISNF